MIISSYFAHCSYNCQLGQTHELGHILPFLTSNVTLAMVKSSQKDVVLMFWCDDENDRKALYWK